jgi:phosphopantetheinyl transferase
MLYIGVLQIREEDDISALSVSLPEEIRERIEKRRNEKERRLSVGAYSLLRTLYGRALGESVEIPEILYTGEGKPYFCGQNENSGLQGQIKFNLSHDGELAVACLSDSADEVGIDVQSEPRRRISLEKIAERFFSPFRNPKERAEREKIDKGEVSLSFYGISDGKITEREGDGVDIRDTAPQFLERWTLLEASLKAAACGFSAPEERDAILRRVRTLTFSVTLSDREYAVSLAVMKK